MTMSDRIAVMNKGRYEQLGDPEGLYERPSTRFVAGFLGISTLLAGAIQGTDGRYATVKLADDTSARAPSALVAGTGTVSIGSRESAWPTQTQAVTSSGSATTGAACGGSGTAASRWGHTLSHADNINGARGGPRSGSRRCRASATGRSPRPRRRGPSQRATHRAAARPNGSRADGRGRRRVVQGDPHPLPGPPGPFQGARIDVDAEHGGHEHLGRAGHHL